MMFSDETNNLVSVINDFSGGKLKNIFGLSFFIEVSEKYNRRKEFQDILFDAKYLNGLVSVFSDVRNSEIINDNLKTEFSSALLSLKNKVNDFVFGMQGGEEFSGKFLGMSQDCLNNFISLVIDLSIAKEYYNSRKFNGIS